MFKFISSIWKENIPTFLLEFCPADCDYSEEMMCPGTWNEDWTEQLTADYCMPYKNGDCPAYCPKQCGEKEMLCPGKEHTDGCKDADYCVAGSKFIFIHLLRKGKSL